MENAETRIKFKKMQEQQKKKIPKKIWLISNWKEEISAIKQRVLKATIIKQWLIMINKCFKILPFMPNYMLIIRGQVP